MTRTKLAAVVATAGAIAVLATAHVAGQVAPAAPSTETDHTTVLSYDGDGDGTND